MSYQCGNKWSGHLVRTTKTTKRILSHGRVLRLFTAGFLLSMLLPPFTKAFQLQPYARYEVVHRNNAADTRYAGGGLNLLFKQHDLKLTLEFDKFMPEAGSAEKSKSIFTVQMQVGI